MSLIKTKTFWTGVTSIASAVALYIGGNEIEALQTFLLGIGMITGRDAIRKHSSPIYADPSRYIRSGGNVPSPSLEGKCSISCPNYVNVETPCLLGHIPDFENPIPCRYLFRQSKWKLDDPPATCDPILDKEG